MAAPQIPNLLSSRGGPRSRGGGRGNGRGTMRRPMFSHIDPQARKDKLIQQTDSDASLSRLSAVKLGYLHDQYAREFVLDQFPPRRLPIINRGTYVRTTAIDRLVDSFITSNDGDIQIVSLGAGTDTRYWRLRDKQIHLNILYHEIDFPTVSRQKLAAIRSSKALSPKGSSFYTLHGPFNPPFEPETNMWGFFRDGLLQSEGYLFHPIDLRKPFMIDHIRKDIPTLLISECCLCYLEVEEARNVLQYFTRLIPTLGIVLYEPTNPKSEFGLQMFANLAARELHMPTVHEYPTLQKQTERLKEAGFDYTQTGADVLWLWNNWVPEQEKERLSGLEMLDELEEWKLLAKHYTVVWGLRESLPDKGSFQKWIDSCKGALPYPESLPEEAYEGISEIKEETVETETETPRGP